MTFDLVALKDEQAGARGARPRRSLDLETESFVRVLPIRWRLLLIAALNARGAAKIYAAARNISGIAASPRLVPIKMDVTSDEDVAKAAAVATEVTLLINNAGVNLIGAVEETSISQAQALFDTNVIGVLRMIRAVLPDMRRQGAGLIVNISSINAVRRPSRAAVTAAITPPAVPP